ncbi:M48 family metallopeptidase [Methanocella sp. MCL-LM]|uniref:M48 metallopeptidase family protein n=1 Tax=Methanocella sp. MCL-LM TaxID=3412035 RepID=UPI003C784FFF
MIFNTRIAMAPVSQLEYVVAHELCHMRFRDHSPKFWSTLKSVLPEYEKRKEALKSDGWKYEF